MADAILTSIFTDVQLWRDALEHGVDKGVPQVVLEKFQSPSFRAQLCREIYEGKYHIQSPHTGYCTKEDGGERMYLVNSPQDRVLLFVVYQWLMRNAEGMIHPSCCSYQKGVGIGKIVRNLSTRIVALGGDVVGRKFDIHKYFDTVDRRCIHQAFDAVERKHGKSCVIDMLRRYYDSDEYYDSRLHQYREAYLGIKQGCAVSSWLANVILFPLDEALSGRQGLYERYSDDIIYVGSDYEVATAQIRDILGNIGLTLNANKIENIRADRFVRYLGYNIRGREISLSRKWVKHFQHEIEQRTILNRTLIHKVRDIRKRKDDGWEVRLLAILKRVEKSVMRYLYYGDGRYSWANHVLGIVNREEDIIQLHTFCLDALRAVYTGKTAIGGLGVSLEKGIVRGKGRNVTANRKATAHLGFFNGYYSICGMQKIISNKWLYRTLVADYMGEHHNHKYPNSEGNEDAAIEQLEELYREYLYSKPDGKALEKYYAKPLELLSYHDFIVGENRANARRQLEDYLRDNIDFEGHLQREPGHWFWQSTRYPELVVLKTWFEGKDK